MRNRKETVVQKGSRSAGDQLRFATMKLNNQDGAHSELRLNLFQTTFALRNTLNELIAGTQLDTPGMRQVLDFAAQHLDLLKHNLPRGCMERREEATTSTTICRHSCLHHVALMDPVIWGGLPKEMVTLVFAHLPLADINRLPCLSKKWNWMMRSTHSDFKNVCADVSQKCFAVISDHSAHGRVLVRVYEMKLNKWHTFEITVGLDRPFHTMMASDGGLVCFICTETKSFNCLPITVCNGLTRHVRQLPVNSLKVLPKMMQLMVNPDAKSYKVIVVGNDETGRLMAELFHSELRMWTSASSSSDIFFGFHYKWGPDPWEVVEDPDDPLKPLNVALSPCMYDCEQGQFLELPVDSQNLYKHINGKTYALVKDHLFVLNLQEHEQCTLGFKTSEYHISEFEAQSLVPNWCKLKDHRCSDESGHAANSLKSILFPEYPDILSERNFPAVYACKGFVLVCFTYQHGRERLYDVSAGKWHHIPALPRYWQTSSTGQEVMCELQWRVIP